MRYKVYGISKTGKGAELNRKRRVHLSPISGNTKKIQLSSRRSGSSGSSFLRALAHQVRGPVDQVEHSEHDGENDARNHVDALGSGRKLRDPRSPTVRVAVDR